MRSKSELAKRISGKELQYSEALALVNDVLKNFDIYWRDHLKQSEPAKGKFVRNAAGTPLGRLLKLIDKKVLAPHDKLVPGFIFGGLTGRNHVQADKLLLGKQRHRTLRGLDITRFFEQILEKRVFYLFYSKAGCSKEASRLLARLCCVPRGAKGTNSLENTLARGFATSPRLAMWCNVDTFLRISWEAKRQLKGHDPRIAVYVDDIGITASNVSKERMDEVSAIIEAMLTGFDPNQPLPIQPSKAKTSHYTEGMQHLGLKLGRRKLSMGSKSRAKRDKINSALKKAPSGIERRKLIDRKHAYDVYQRQITKTTSP